MGADLLYVDEHRKRFEAGDKDALIRAIRFCFNQEIVAPEWIVQAFFQATNKWYSLQVKELGEAFGLQWPKGVHLNAAKKRRRLQSAVMNRINEAHRTRSRPIDDELFEEIGKSLKPPIGKTLVKEYYQAAFIISGDFASSPAMDMLIKDYVVPGHTLEASKRRRKK